MGARGPPSLEGGGSLSAWRERQAGLGTEPVGRLRGLNPGSSVRSVCPACPAGHTQRYPRARGALAALGWRPRRGVGAQAPLPGGRSQKGAGAAGRARLWRGPPAWLHVPACSDPSIRACRRPGLSSCRDHYGGPGRPPRSEDLRAAEAPGGPADGKAPSNRRPAAAPAPASPGRTRMPARRRIPAPDVQPQGPRTRCRLWALADEPPQAGWRWIAQAIELAMGRTDRAGDRAGDAAQPAFGARLPAAAARDPPREGYYKCGLSELSLSIETIECSRH